MRHVIATRELWPAKLDGVQGASRPQNWAKVPSSVKRALEYLQYGSNRKRRNSAGRVS